MIRDQSTQNGAKNSAVSPPLKNFAHQNINYAKFSKQIIRKHTFGLNFFLLISLWLLIFAFSGSSICNELGAIDLEINETDIFFSEEKPVENKLITITSNITNKGDKEALNVPVKFLDDNNVLGNASWNISCNSTINVSRNWTTEIGPNNITLVLDALNSIEETNETNNNATRNMTISGHSLYSGNVFASRIILGSGASLFNLSGISTHVLVVDSDSDVDFSSLQSLGRKKNGDAASSDFNELDTALNMSSFNDSIANLYSLDGTAPKQTASMRVEYQILQNIPFVNSTNTSSFITGILWDTSDDASSNGEFDSTDKEDIVFVAKINSSQKGAYGTYDYEILIPSLLRSYTGTTPTVDFFLDVQ